MLQWFCKALVGASHRSPKDLCALKQAQVFCWGVSKPSVASFTSVTSACVTFGCVMQAYYRVYKEHIPVAQLCRETAAVMQEFTRTAPLLLLTVQLPIPPYSVHANATL